MFHKIGNFLSKIDYWRDKVLFVFIERYWPRFITPNHLSYLRVLISFLLIWMFLEIETWKYFILPVFLIGALTDMLDGSVARCLNKATKFGSILDSVADRMLLVPAAIFLLLPANMLLLLFLFISELANSFVSWIGLRNKILIESNIFAKAKMFVQALAFLGMLFFPPKPVNNFLIFILWITVFTMFVSVFIKMKDLKNIYDSKNKNI